MSGNNAAHEQTLTATPPLLPPGTGFTIAGVLKRVLSTLRARPAIFFALAVFFQLPVLFVGPLAEAVIDDIATSTLISIGPKVMLMQIMQGTAVYAAYGILKGESVSLGAILISTLRRLPHMLAISCLFGLVCFIGVILLRCTVFQIPGGIGVLLGSILMYGGGLAIFSFIPVMISACAVEKLGPLASINRGSMLMKGFRLKILMLYFLALLGLVAAVVASIFIASTLGLGRITSLVVMNFLQVLPTTVFATLGPVVYYGLREAKESV